MTKQNNQDRQEDRQGYRPSSEVHLDSAALKQVAKDGLEFRREIEKRAARMFVPSQADDARSRLR